MDKVRRKETRRRGERDHKYLLSLDLYISVTLKARECDFKTADYFIPDEHLR